MAYLLRLTFADRAWYDLCDLEIFQGSDWEPVTMVNLRDMMVMTDRVVAMIRIRAMGMVMPIVSVSPG